MRYVMGDEANNCGELCEKNNLMIVSTFHFQASVCNSYVLNAFDCLFHILYFLILYNE